MTYYADLHVHSRYSRATSRDACLEDFAYWARMKVIAVVGTGDFTHPAWFAELQAGLVPAEPGLFRLRPELEARVESRLPPRLRAEGAGQFLPLRIGHARFMLQVEISTIYKKAGATRKAAQSSAACPTIIRPPAPAAIISARVSSAPVSAASPAPRA